MTHTGHQVWLEVKKRPWVTTLDLQSVGGLPEGAPSTPTEEKVQVSVIRQEEAGVHKLAETTMNRGLEEVEEIMGTEKYTVRAAKGAPR